MKVRRIDFSADEFIAGITGKLTVADLGVYWLVCSLIYSHGGPIDDDEKWIAAIFRDTNPRTVRAAIERLILMSKIQRMGGELMVNRCRKELERASNRVRTWTENGLKGGRPSSKINEIAEPNGLSENNRASNHQLSTINEQKKEDIIGGDPPKNDASKKNGHLFDAWYAGYPRKVGKGAAKRAFDRIIAKGEATPEQLDEGLKRYIRTKPPTQVWCHPSTWLNGERWLDQENLGDQSAGRSGMPLLDFDPYRGVEY